MNSWSLRARRVDGFIHLQLELRDPLGVVLDWADIPAVRRDDAREALLAARVVHEATRGAVSRGATLRLIRAQGAR